MKKILALLLALIMVLSMAACSGSEPVEDDDDEKASTRRDGTSESKNESTTPGGEDIPTNDGIDIDGLMASADSPAEDFIVIINSEDTGILSGYFGEEEIVVIPEYLDEVKVTQIYKGVFQENMTVKAIRFPECTQTIGEQQFRDAKNLQMVYLGSGVQEIGDDAFAGCSEELVILGVAGSYAQQYAEQNGITFSPVERSDAPSTDTQPQKIEAAPLSLYGQINDTNYVAAVLYDGDGTWVLDGPFSGKVIVAVYDIGSSLNETQILEDGFVEAASDNGFLYHFAIGSSAYLFDSCITDRYFDDGRISYAPVGSVTDAFTQLGKREIVSIYTRDKDHSYENDVVGDGWYATPSSDESTTSSVYVKIGETDTENVYAHMTTSEPIPIDDDFAEAMDAAVKGQMFKQTLMVLDDINDPSSVSQCYGKEIDLSETVMYQDLIASKVSDMYGLTLKDKSTYLHLDNTYIQFRRYDEAGDLRQVKFTYFSDESEYRDGAKEGVYETFISRFGIGLSYTDENGSTYEFTTNGSGVHYIFKDKMLISVPECQTLYNDFVRCVEDRYSYTNVDGNTYDYFNVDTISLYIFKNEQLIGIAETNGNDHFEGVSALFGIDA